MMLAGEPDITDEDTGLFVSWRVSYVRPSENGLRDYTGRLTGNFSKPAGHLQAVGRDRGRLSPQRLRRPQRL